MQEAIANMKENALKSQLASRSTVGTAFWKLDDDGRPLMPSTSSLSRNIRRSGQREEKVPLSIPWSRIVYVIPEELTCLETKEISFTQRQWDGGRKWKVDFGTSIRLHDLETHKNWASDEAFQTCAESYYQLHIPNVNMGRACIAPIHDLLQNKNQFLVEWIEPSTNL